ASGGSGDVTSLATISADRASRLLVTGTLSVLGAATIIGVAMRLAVRTDTGRRTIENINARIRAWWIMAGVFGLAIHIGPLGATILFGLVSFLALREMLTLAPTRRGDHNALFWAFFIITPLQYYFVYIDWYGMFAIFIPVY